jgi:SAM-dependent methyltransferase
VREKARTEAPPAANSPTPALNPSLAQHARSALDIRSSRLHCSAMVEAEPARTDRDLRCRLCLGHDTHFEFEWLGFSWRSCPSCGALQKALSLEAYRALRPTYDPGSYADDIADEATLRKVVDVEEKTALLRSVLGSGTHQAFLEVGCGMGGYLLAARDLGYRVCGVEPSTQHSAAARNLTDLRIVDGYYEPGMLGHKFDVIMLSHVIEHIYLPKEFLASLALDLLPGGRLIVITPNAGSLAARSMGKYWSMLKPIDHVSMFTKRALRLACPESLSLERATTSEWPGEFAALCVSAVKSYLRSHATPIEPVAGSKPRRTATQFSISSAQRAILALLSAPFWLGAKAWDNQACLLAVYRPRSGEHP